VKWVGLFIVLGAIFPLSRWLRQNPNHAPKVWLLVGCLPFVTAYFHLYMAIISWPNWSGYVKGIEFSVLDGLMLALYFSSRSTRHPLPFRFSMALYFLAALLSVLQAEVPMAALFYVWQLARMFLVYAVVARACADSRVPLAILRGFGVSMCLEVGVTIWQRFGLGILRPPGTVDTQNLLGLMSHLAALPPFALVLAGQSDWLIAAAAIGGAVVDAMTTSRGAVGFSAMGYAAVFVISALRKWSSRKALILSASAFIVIAVAPIAVSSFKRRFAIDEQLYGDSTYHERAAFEAAAAMMLSDRPMGWGANNYVLAVNTNGYNARAGVAEVEASEAANVHNIYWLIAAETGYLGIVTYMLLLVRPLTVAFRCGWRNRRDPRGDLLLGLGVALLTVYVHNCYEWVFISFEPQYLFAMALGLVAGLAEQLGYWRHARLGSESSLGGLSKGSAKLANHGVSRTNFIAAAPSNARPHSE
jgi:O-antigen ligase